MEADIQILETAGVLGTAVATVLLVLLLWKAIKQMEATVSLSRVQTNLRFRGWVGPSSGIKHIGKSSDGRYQYEIIIKNFGEIVAEQVTVSCKKDTKIIEKEDPPKDLEVFELGPLLPSMEKRYWIFVDEQLMNKVKNEEEKLFIYLYIGYPVSNGKSGYGMVSEYEPKKEIFVHRKMWVDNPKSNY